MIGTVITIAVDGSMKAQTFDKPIAEARTLQEIVGGYIEIVPGFDSIIIDDVLIRCVAFSNEDGKRLQLPLNKKATMAWANALRRRGDTLFRPAAHGGGLWDALCGPDRCGPWRRRIHGDDVMSDASLRAAATNLLETIDATDLPPAHPIRLYADRMRAELRGDEYVEDREANMNRWHTPT